jgi:hypothetical protein
MFYTVTYLNHRTWKRTVRIEADSISAAWKEIMDGNEGEFIDCELVAEKSELVEANKEIDWDESHAAVTMGVK